jgi:hypothetical protein
MVGIQNTPGAYISINDLGSVTLFASDGNPLLDIPLGDINSRSFS